MWRLAESLKRLREQINEAYPSRDKSSDGSIGDENHASRKSDHNPWVKDKNGIGVVTAIDIDRDFNDGHDARELVAALQASKDKRLKYLIFERKITVKGDITQWKPYTGVNAHNHHVHISVSANPALYDDTTEWQLDFAANTSSPQSGADVSDADALTHKVEAGDSLWKLASQYQISVSELKHKNGLTSDKILVGQVLKLK